LNKKHRNRSSYQFAKLILFVCVILFLLIVHLIGKVNIDVVLIKNDELAEKRESLKKRIDELKVNINKKRGYKRIVNLAKKQGLIFVPPTCISELEVDVNSNIKDSIENKNIFSKLAQAEVSTNDIH